MLDALVYLAVAFLGCFGIYFFGFQRKERDWERISVLSLSLSLFLVLALRCIAEFRCGSWEWIFTGIQTVFDVLEGNSGEFRTALSVIPVVPELLSCAVPALTVFTAAQLLWHYLPHHVPMGKGEWFLFSDLDANSVRMAKNLARKDSLCIFLRTRRNKADTDLLKELEGIPFFLYPGDEARFLLWPCRRRKLLRFFFLSENTDENFQRMQDFLTAAGEKRLFTPRNVSLPDGQFQQELYLLSETESAPMLIGHLREILKTSRCFRNTELRLLDRFRATSYDLLLKQPLQAHIDGDKLHVLVLGFGKIGREFFRAACHLGVDRRCKPEFTLCDVQICDKLNHFRSQCPELSKSVRFRHIKLDAETAALDALLKSQDYHYILVALGDDERNIRVASRLKRFYRLRHWDDVAQRRTGDLQPQICVNLEDSIKHSYTKELWTKTFEGDRALRVFGGLDQVFTEEVLIPRNLHRAARWIHRELNRSRITGEVQEKAHWGEYERRSSIACALHAQFHAASFGENYSALLHQYKSDDYSKLIDMEHDRWMAYVRSEGLRKSEPNLMEAYYNTKNGRHVDILGKLTPCLAEPDELATLWTRLLAKDNDYYSGQYTFRERDELVVLNAKIIAQGIDTGEFPERSIPKITT